MYGQFGIVTYLRVDDSWYLTSNYVIKITVNFCIT